MQNQFNILSIDPGRSKWGLAILNSSRQILANGVYSINEFPQKVLEMATEYEVKCVVLGNRTGSKQAREALLDGGLSHPIELVEEHNSTLEARELYFQRNPPPWYKAWIPRGLLVPSEDYDDCTAMILAYRYFDGKSETGR